MEELVGIFDEIQRSGTTHKTCTKSLTKLFNEKNAQLRNDAIALFHRGFIDNLLIYPKNAPKVDRCLQFCATFLSTMNEEFLANSLEHVCSRLASTNKIVRQRCCQLVYATFAKLTEKNMELSVDLIDGVKEQVIIRLRDKIPAVRAAAAKAISFLISMEEDEVDPAYEELVRLLTSDSSCTVRVAALEAIPISQDSLKLVVARLKDINADVRIAAINVLQKENRLKYLRPAVKASVISLGLTDRDGKVRAAMNQLIVKWLVELKGDDKILQALKLLNPIENEADAQLLGAAMLEEIAKRDTQWNDVTVAMRNSAVDWTAGLNAVTTQEILWTFLRCSHARRFSPEAACFEVFEALCPDALVIGQLLSEMNTFALAENAKLQFVVKYVLMMVTLLDGADVSGCLQLNDMLKTMLADMNLPPNLVETTLKALYALSEVTATRSTVHLEVLQVAESVRDNPNAQSMPTSAASADDEDVIENSAELMACFRATQLIRFVLQNDAGVVKPTTTESNTAEKVANNEAFMAADYEKSVLPFVMTSLQAPYFNLRRMAVACIGLLCLSSLQSCASYQSILLQVASTDLEDESIRCTALQCLVDVACVHTDVYRDDSDLTNVLLRIQARGEAALARVATEGAVKLLFNGVLSEPQLFANVLRFFFVTQEQDNNISLEEEAMAIDAKTCTIETMNGNDILAATSVGSTSRLQQILSIFLKSFVYADSRSEQVVLSAVSTLLADLAVDIRNEELASSTLARVVKHLLSMCDEMEIMRRQKTESTASNGNNTDSEPTLPVLTLFGERLAAALCRELFKLGRSKHDKATLKEFVKVLASVEPQSWIRADNVGVAVD